MYLVRNGIEGRAAIVPPPSLVLQPHGREGVPFQNPVAYRTGSIGQADIVRGGCCFLRSFLPISGLLQNVGKHTAGTSGGLVLQAALPLPTACKVVSGFQMENLLILGYMPNCNVHRDAPVRRRCEAFLYPVCGLGTGCLHQAGVLPTRMRRPYDLPMLPL